MKQYDLKPVLMYKYASLQLNYVLHDQYKCMSDLPRIVGGKEVVAYFQDHYRPLSNAQEFFSIMLLSRHNRILNVSTIGQGNKFMTIVDISYLTALALLTGATAIIICHNHPSGNNKPSEDDKELTKKVKAALSSFDIQLLDHIIITADDECWYSMAAEGEI